MPETRLDVIDRALGSRNLKNVDWRDPLEFAATVVWFLLTATAIIWIPLCAFSGGWLFGVALFFIWAECQPPIMSTSEYEDLAPAARLAKTPEALYRERLVRVRQEEQARLSDLLGSSSIGCETASAAAKRDELPPRPAAIAAAQDAEASTRHRAEIARIRASQEAEARRREYLR
jgi:hypothetical protein